jgi:hypothetical protein
MNKRGYNCQEAAHYLGIKRRAFEKHFRPLLTGAPIGTSLVFDRFDLDRVLEEYLQRNGRPVEKGGITWAELKLASTRTSKDSGVSIGYTKALDFATVSSRLNNRKAGLFFSLNSFVRFIFTGFVPRSHSTKLLPNICSTIKKRCPLNRTSICWKGWCPL